MTATYAAWIALAAPLAGLAFTIAVGSSVSRRTVGVVASGAILGGFVAACVALVSLLRRSPDQRVELSTGWHWLSAGRFDAHVTILVDPLSVIMLLVVTGVGFLIHAYSVGYMHGDREERRFFAYLNLFVFSMLLLVLAGDFIILLAGWGMVGLSSYLLIGFWWDRPAAVAAAKKAFIMNAIGDIGIALGIFVIWNHVHATDYLTVFGQAGGAGIPIGSQTANWIALLLLVGAVAKSAQLPLQTWLPDAMEGPTPVSALIHAATMVTAGVYLVARMWPLYTAAPDVSDLVALIGAATLTMAGLIALVQTDIKRVIAYSTMSQIGYMFCAVGIGAYSAGIYHLLTHAFFKALLFLGAGVVIHALDDEQDMRNMGGLRRFMPYTAALMWIGGLALCRHPAVRRLLLEGSDPRGRDARRRHRGLDRLVARAARRVRDVDLHVPHAAQGLLGPALALRGRARAEAHGARRGADLDALDDRRAGGRGAARRPARDPGRDPRDAQLPRARGATRRRGDRRTGALHVRALGRGRARRPRGRLRDLGAERPRRRRLRPRDRSAAAPVRAEVRLRPRLRPADRPARRALAALGARGSGRAG